MRTFCLCLTALKVNRLVKTQRENPDFSIRPIQLTKHENAKDRQRLVPCTQICRGHIPFV